MITKLELTNYKSHKHTVLEFDKLVGIVGDNGSGKSNIFRALQTVLLNKSFTKKHIRRGEKEARICVTFDDGRQIEKIRTSSTLTTYLRNLNTNEVSKYIGSQGLTEKINNFSHFQEGSSDGPENLQLVKSSEQFFLIDGWSDETILKRVSNLFSSTSIETAKISLESKLRGLSQRMLIKREEQTNLDNRLKRYENIKTIKKEFKHLDKIIDEIRQIDSMLSDIDGLIKAYHLAGSLLVKTHETYSEMVGNADLIHSYKQKRRLIENQIRDMHNYIENYKSKHKDLVALNKEIESINKVCPLCGK